MSTAAKARASVTVAAAAMLESGDPGTEEESSAMDIACAGCGAALRCDPGPDCWCAELPFQPMPAGPAACLCRACLTEQIEKTKKGPHPAGRVRRPF